MHETYNGRTRHHHHRNNNMATTTVSQFRAAALANDAYLSVVVSRPDRQVALVCLHAGEFYPEWVFYEGTQSIELIDGSCIVTVDARVDVAAAGSTVFVPRGVTCMLANASATSPARLYITSTAPQTFAPRLQRQRAARNGSFSPFARSAPALSLPPLASPASSSWHDRHIALLADSNTYEHTYVRTLFDDDDDDGGGNWRAAATDDDSAPPSDGTTELATDDDAVEESENLGESDESFSARVLVSLPRSRLL